MATMLVRGEEAFQRWREQHPEIELPETVVLEIIDETIPAQLRHSAPQFGVEEVLEEMGWFLFFYRQDGGMREAMRTNDAKRLFLLVTKGHPVPSSRTVTVPYGALIDGHRIIDLKPGSVFEPVMHQEPGSDICTIHPEEFASYERHYYHVGPDRDIQFLLLFVR